MSPVFRGSLEACIPALSAERLALQFLLQPFSYALARLLQ